MVDNFYNWFMMLPSLEQVFWVCAMISSFFFVIQLLLTLIGMDSSDVCVDFAGPDTMDLGGGFVPSLIFSWVLAGVVSAYANSLAMS